MKTQKLKLNGYLLLISCPYDINHPVKRLKKELHQSIGDYTSKNSKAHISLMSFQVPIIETYITESKLVERLKGAAKNFKPFDIMVKNYNKFESSGTLYIDIETKEPIEDLNKKIRRRIRTLASRSNFNNINHPHITIARRLRKDQMDYTWNLFKEERFQANMEVNCLTLLKYEGEDKKKFIADIPLGSWS